MVQPLPPSYRFRAEDLDRSVEPAVERRAARELLPAVIAAVIIIGSGAGGAMLLLDAVPAVADRGVTAPARPGAGELTAEPGPAPPAPGAVAAGAEPEALRKQATADRAAVQELIGRWVPQLSAKAVGRVIDGVVYDEARIWSEYRALRARYPEVALVRSDDYRSFAQPEHWVVLLGRPFDTAEAANTWCDRHDFAPDDCFAKRLSRTGGPTANTVSRH